MKRAAGFTLIELMIVISVISILATIFGVSLAKNLPNQRLYSTVRDLQSAMQSARLLAVKHNVDVAVACDLDTDSLEVFEDDGPTPGVRDVGEIVYQTVGNIKNVDFYNADMGGVRFNSRGFPDTSGGIYLKSSLGEYRGVQLSLTGNSRIIASTDEGASWY